MQKENNSNKLMRLPLLLVPLLLFFILTGCNGLKTPEELIGPPEVNLERKLTEDTIRKFLPINSEIIPPQEKGIFNAETVYEANLAYDNSNEIVALYRDKSSRKIGLIGIKKTGDMWSKMVDLSIDAFEISDYYIVDLDLDGESEIIIGYFSINSPFKSMIILGNSNGAINKIYETEYLGFNIGSEKNGTHNIAFSTIGAKGKNNKFVIMDYFDGKIRKADELVYSENIDIYKITYGALNNDIEGFFLDMYVDESTGKTDILGRNEDGLYSILKKIGISEIKQEVPIASTDFNNDGMIELVANKVLVQHNESTLVLLNKYFSVNNKNKMVPLADVIEDHYNNIKISFPPLENWDLENKLKVESKKDAVEVSLYSDYTQKYHTFLTIKIIPKSENFDNSYTLVTERGDYYIIGKKYKIDDTSYFEKMKFDNFLNTIGNLSEIIKIIE